MAGSAAGRPPALFIPKRSDSPRGSHNRAGQRMAFNNLRNSRRRHPHSSTRKRLLERGVESIVQSHEKYPIAEQSWANMLSENTTMVVRLDQRGGLCDPRLRMHHPASRCRLTSGSTIGYPRNRRYGATSMGFIFFATCSSRSTSPAPQ
jgi:hypothetical protein